MAFTPEEEARWAVKRRAYREAQEDVLRWGIAWVNALRDYGIPIRGQFEEMTSDKYTSPEDAWCVCFGEFSCSNGCMMHTEATPLRYRDSLHVYIGEYAMGLSSIERRAKPERYHIEWGDRDGGKQVTKGYSPWEEGPAPLRPQDLAARLYESIAQYGCDHLRKILALDDKDFETHLQLNLL